MAYEDILDLLHRPDLPYPHPDCGPERPSGLPWEGYYYSAYGIAVKHGYSGTEEEWLASLKGERGAATELRYNADSNFLEWKYADEETWHELMSLTELQTELEAATIDEVITAKLAAQAAASSATGSASAAAGSASAASTSETNASASASAASGSAAAAAGSASAAGASASAAQSAQSAAETAKTAAAASATTAGEKATAAAGSATDAATAKTGAETAKTAAQTAATTATTQATAAAGSATNASTSATAAAGSATAAAGSASDAAAAKSDAETAAGTATEKATAAAGSATSAAGSAAAAAGSAVSADQSAEAASQSAKAAADSAEEAAEILEEFTTPTASATTLSPGSDATASYANGNFSFGIPEGEKGDTGDSGVYVGEDEPTDPNVTVWLNPSGQTSSYATEGYVDDAVGNEETARQAADAGLQTQIDAITSQSDVVDVVGTYAELQAYTKPTYVDDIVKVLTDSTHSDAIAYYRCAAISGTAPGTPTSWTYIGSQGPFYTKSETDTLLNNKQATLVSGTNIKTVNGNSVLGSGNLTIREVPSCTASDNGKFLRVVNGAAAWQTVETMEGGSY